MDGLNYRGGDDLAGTTRNMLRHAVAALLNGCSSDVLYPVSDWLVIEMVNIALDSEDVEMIHGLHTMLASYNEDTPCPINAHCQRMNDQINGD